MEQGDRERLEAALSAARGLGSCVDAEDHGFGAWAEEHGPRFQAAIGEALAGLSDEVRAHPVLARWLELGGGPWWELARVLRELLG